MAVENITFGGDFGEALASIPGLTDLIRIGKIAGVVIIVYIVFLIFKGIMEFSRVKYLKSIEKNVIEINKKLDKKRR